MTRGNQRDLARAKNQKKQQEMQKKKTASEKTGLSLTERKHRDAELMREKQRKKKNRVSHVIRNKQFIEIYGHLFDSWNVMNNFLVLAFICWELKLFK